MFVDNVQVVTDADKTIRKEGLQWQHRISRFSGIQQVTM